MPQQHVDGVSLAPLLTGEGELSRQTLYWHFPNYISGHPGPATPCGVIRHEDWKLIEFFEDGRLELYNLSSDMKEERDLAIENPGKAKELHNMLKEWRKIAKVQMPQVNPAYEE